MEDKVGPFDWAKLERPQANRVEKCTALISRKYLFGFPDEEVPFGLALGHIVIPFTYGCAMAEAVCPHLLMPDAPQQLISWRNSCWILSRYPARICQTRVCQGARPPLWCEVVSERH